MDKPLTQLQLQLKEANMEQRDILHQLFDKFSLKVALEHLTFIKDLQIQEPRKKRFAIVEHTKRITFNETRMYEASVGLLNDVRFKLDGDPEELQEKYYSEMS